MNVNAPNFSQFSQKIDAWLQDAETLAVHVARGLAVEIFKKAVKGSPVFSGDFMASWNFSVGTPDLSFKSMYSVAFGRAEHGYLHRYETEEVGSYDDFALTAMERNAGRESGVTKLGQMIYISNGAQHDDEYAWMIEDNLIKFRPQNEGKGRIGRRSLEKVGSTYGMIGQAEALHLSLQELLEPDRDP